MADVKAITLQGINHHLDTINTQDGMCEDLVNLRFKDGGWRVSDDGLNVFDIWAKTGIHYEQLFIHTNVYRHLLGVNPTTHELCWFANLTPKDSEESVEHELFDIEELKEGGVFCPQKLCSVEGDLFISTTGHVITIIDHPKEVESEEGKIDTFQYFVFKKNTSTYKQAKVDENGEQGDRELFPFGNIHFNLYSPFEMRTVKETKSWKSHMFALDTGLDEHYYMSTHDQIVTVYSYAQNSNLFTKPFLVTAALQLYDGSYAMACSPTLLFPRMKPLYTIVTGYNSSGVPTYKEVKSASRHVDIRHGVYSSSMQENHDKVLVYEQATASTRQYVFWEDTDGTKHHSYDKSECRQEYIDTSTKWVFDDHIGALFHTGCARNESDKGFAAVLGSEIVCTISDKLATFVKGNSELFNKLCIFVTPEADVYDINGWSTKDTDSGDHQNFKFLYQRLRTFENITNELRESNFYKLYDFDYDTIGESGKSEIVNIRMDKYEGLLKNLSQEDILPSSAFSRQSILPKAQCVYNGRLHVANYTAAQFHGYPMESFHLNGHSVKISAGAVYKRYLKDLADAGDKYFNRERFSNRQLLPDLGDAPASIKNTLPSVVVITTLDTDDGEQKVARAIMYKDLNLNLIDGTSEYLEVPDLFMSFPDYRAKKMDVYIMTLTNNAAGTVTLKHREFELKRHIYLNIASFIWDNFKEINYYSWETITKSYEWWRNILKEYNNKEYYPNGLKVSETNNPFVFNPKHTYQVGSSEIVALCANAISVGTGQTGQAPLFVFTKDGIYALFVDSSGELAYTNSRVIARDVCNNAKSVTPIDKGVVFTTDRGLMNIAGNTVEEIGQPLEGDYNELDSTKERVLHNAFTMSKLGNLPTNAKTKAEFLHYLKGAIVCYNHNERELMVSNPDYEYTYVLEDEGNWSRRDYTADEYVNNYPTAYRVKNGKMYQVDNESGTKENGMFLVTRAIKLDSIGFKQIDRFVTRGMFTTAPTTINYTAEIQGGEVEVSTQVSLFDSCVQAVITPDDLVSAYKVIIQYKDGTSHSYGTSGGKRTLTINNPKDVSSIVIKNEVGRTHRTFDITINCNQFLGMYVYGSYDGRKWALLGHREKTGSFTDIGCLVSHPDCKFFRVCLAGQLTSDSRLDYFEVSCKGSKLNTKIR